MATRLSNEHVASLEVISHCRNEEEQPLNYRLTSLESEQILAADSQLPLARLYRRVGVPRSNTPFIFDMRRNAAS